MFLLCEPTELPTKLPDGPACKATPLSLGLTVLEEGVFGGLLLGELR